MPDTIKNTFMTHNIDIAGVAAALKECALQYVLPRFRNLQDADIQTKKHANDFVTIADVEAEHALTRLLPTLYPGAIVIGEEAVASGTATTDALGDLQQTIFVVDPVDGTYNFKNGDPRFAMMVALVVGGETRAGWIYDVMNDTHYIAEKGRGATRNGQPLRVRSPRDLTNSDTVGYGAAGRFASLRCAGHEYLNIAAGDADFAVYTHMNPWDHLAGTLLVQEAGGCVAKFDGTAYNLTDTKGGIIVASHRDVLEQVRTDLLMSASKGTSPEMGGF